MRRVGARSTRAALGAGRPTVVRRGYGRSARVRPRQARPSRVAPRDFTSESFHRVDMRRVGAGRPTVARRGCGRDKRGPPVWRRAISLRNHSDAIYSTPLHGHSSTSRFDTDRWCTPTDGAFATQIIKKTRDSRILCPFRFAMFDYRGDKVLVDHDSGLGWILLRIEISRHMKSHAVRPCARRRSGCPFLGPPCRPGRRRTCVYGRNELHPSRHGHLTRLGRSDAPRRGRRGYFARRAS